MNLYLTIGCIVSFALYSYGVKKLGQRSRDGDIRADKTQIQHLSDRIAVLIDKNETLQAQLKTATSRPTVAGTLNQLSEGTM